MVLDPQQAMMQSRGGATIRRLALTVPEVAEALGIGLTLTRKLVASGELPSRRIGRTVRVPVVALEEYLARQS